MKGRPKEGNTTSERTGIRKRKTRRKQRETSGGNKGDDPQPMPRARCALLTVESKNNDYLYQGERWGQ